MLEIKTRFLREDTVISDMVGIMGALEFPSLSSPSSYWIISLSASYIGLNELGTERRLE